MEIIIEKASGRSYCRYAKCAGKFDDVNGCIKKGVITAVFHFHDGTSRYCIDKIYQDMLGKLNPKLWAFL